MSDPMLFICFFWMVFLRMFSSRMNCFTSDACSWCLLSFDCMRKLAAEKSIESPFTWRPKPEIVLFKPILFWLWFPKFMFEIFLRYWTNVRDFGDIISWSLGENWSHGSLRMSFVDGLLSGFLWNILRRSCFPCLEIWSARGRSYLQMLVYSSLSFWPLKGNRPHKSA